MVLLTVGLAVIGSLGLLGTLYGVLRESRRIRQETRILNSRLEDYSQAFKEFFDGTDEDPSPFAQTVQNIANHLGQVQALSTQAAIRGSLGGQAKALNQEIQAAALEEDPSLAVLEFLPKSLRNKPVAQAFVQQIVHKALAGKKSGLINGGNGNVGDRQVRFNF